MAIFVPSHLGRFVTHCCPCLICCKTPRPSCSCSPDSAGCSDCVQNFSDHVKYHGCFHPICKYCIQIVKIIPYFNFWFLSGINFRHQWQTRRKVSREHFQVKAPKVNTDPPAHYPNLNQMGLFEDYNTYYERMKGLEGLKDWKFCDECGYSFRRIAQLREHIERNHQVSKRLFNCYHNDLRKKGKKRRTAYSAQPIIGLKLN